MDSGQIELATALIHMSSLFGFITNTIAFMTIKLNTKLHSSFGIICACLAANTSFVLVLNSIWYLMPDSEIFVAGSVASRVVGTIGLTLWMLGNRFHLLISINRLIAIASPFTSHAYMTNRNTIIVLLFALFTVALQCSPLILVESIWFCYDRKTMRWVFSDTENGRFFFENVCDLAITIELTSILLLDIITLAHLRTYNKIRVLSDVNVEESRSMEIRLFKQSFSQSIPLLVDFISFAYITPLFAEDFSKFMTTTFVWHMEHVVDGLIIGIFHTRRELFTRKKESSNSLAPNAA